jgi:formate hydrogenlyase transcriptional activator
LILRREFRADLYYRLNVFLICVPPLRERARDIPLLVRHFIIRAAKRINKTIEYVPKESMAALLQYSWPGNIRELENVIERAVILSRGSRLEIQLRDLNSQIKTGQDTLQDTLEEVERNHILATLKQTGWVISGPRGAATRLGLNRSTLQFRMKKLGILRSMESSFCEIGQTNAQSIPRCTHVSAQRNRCPRFHFLHCPD